MIETSPDFMFCRGDRILIAADVALNAAPRDGIVFASVNGRAFNVERSAVVGATWLAINVGDEIETDDGEPIGIALAVTDRWIVAQYGDQAPKAHVRIGVRPLRKPWPGDE